MKRLGWFIGFYVSGPVYVAKFAGEIEDDDHIHPN